jgi:hypothetical protein
MTGKYFLLEAKDNSRLTRIFQFALGILCILIALFWMVFNFRSLKADSALWITIIFLIGFGLFEILAGLGKTVKYIEIFPERIILKQNSVLPQIELKTSDIEKIEIFPLSIAFTGKNRNRHILRFGITYPEIISPVKEAVTEFAGLNNIPVEMKEEEI